MFTDVENSTKYWDSRGDVEGRLMVDLHNRLVCPVIKRFKGRVVKHVGDAIMATFKSPAKAVKAAIGIQQILEHRRTEEGAKLPSVRIGVHTGKALVEQTDVFGDVVNVAARVGDYARGCEICISGSTASKISKKDFNLLKRGKVIPKGKRKAIAIYECRWRNHEALVEDFTETAALPLVKRQKFELVGYALASAAVLSVVCVRYLRYLALDFERAAVLATRLPPLRLTAPVLLGTALLLPTLLAVRRPGSHFYFRMLKGGFGFAVTFLVALLAVKVLPIRVERRYNEVLYKTRHDFVTLQEDDVAVRTGPGHRARKLAEADRGDVLLVEDFIIRARQHMNWFKVLAGRDLHGWVPQVLPAELGVPERPIAVLTTFRFRYKDLYVFAAALLGFLWGAFTFKIRPA
jgi:class 3 adenylate cyclase